MIVMSILIFFFFLLFRHFCRNSANFSAKCLFGKVAFRQNGFSAKWFLKICRASSAVCCCQSINHRVFFAPSFIIQTDIFKTVFQILRLSFLMIL